MASTTSAARASARPSPRLPPTELYWQTCTSFDQQTHCLPCHGMGQHAPVARRGLRHDCLQTDVPREGFMTDLSVRHYVHRRGCADRCTVCGCNAVSAEADTGSWSSSVPTQCGPCVRQDDRGVRVGRSVLVGQWHGGAEPHTGRLQHRRRVCSPPGRPLPGEPLPLPSML